MKQKINCKEDLDLFATELNLQMNETPAYYEDKPPNLQTQSS